MPKTKVKSNESSYKARSRRNGGQDRYGQFKDGRQMSSDLIAGHQIWSVERKREV
jgi:hypothetical protein